MIEITVPPERRTHVPDITGVAAERLPAEAEGLVCRFCPHTTAASVIGENEEKLKQVR